MAKRWRIWVDTGGTFTDAIAVDPDGGLHRSKILSSGALRGTLTARTGANRFEIHHAWSIAPEGLRGLDVALLADERAIGRVSRCDLDASTLEIDRDVAGEIEFPAPFELTSGDEAAVLSARLLTGTPCGGSLPACSLRLATTLGTNALLQRSGDATALFVTRGFGDLLEIGSQQRPDLFTLEVRKPRPLYDAVVEVPERLDADGNVLVPLDLEPVEREARALLAQGVRSAAVALMHAYRDPAHEQRVARKLLDLGFEQVSCSAALAPRIRILPRAETAVVDAYLGRRMRSYVEGVERAVGRGGLLMMTSAGGLVASDDFRPKDGLLSGPAGGVAGAAVVARRAGVERAIGFDMGGTSTDVARWDGDFDYVYEHRVGDAHLAAPALAIETVAAGGGSVCRREGERLRVGPQSAGAHPGPACYGAGGPLALTDVNLLLGRLDPDRFQIPISEVPARARLRELSESDGRTTPDDRTEPEALLQGLLDIADERMADAIRRVSVRRGYDPADYSLVAFGGAGGQHACAVAERLGTTRVLVPADASLLSALGLGHAVIERFVERQVLSPMEEVEPLLAGWFDELAGEAAAAVAATGALRDRLVTRRRTVHVRFAGQDSTLGLEWDPDVPILRSFARRYEQLYGHRPGDRAVELESIRVVVSETAPPDGAGQPAAPPRAVEPEAKRFTWFGGRRLETSVHHRPNLPTGSRFAGPALVFEPRSATVVPPGWTARVDGHGTLVLEREGARAASTDARHPEAIRLELFTQRFAAVVGEMGERLERTAVSTNVKERTDFSCALLDPQGELVANAPHIPVHLGALGICVRRVADAVDLRPGDVVATNHPGYGGSHLPDVTVITPVFRGTTRIGFLASRAHHAEIGGTRPGSMPPSATRLVEEGVVLPPTHLLRGGRPEWDAVRDRFEHALYPSRNVEDNLADLKAAVAANHAGLRALSALADEHGTDTLVHYMAELKRLAESCVRRALSRLADGRYEATELLDDGTPLEVAIDVNGETASFDFSGSGAVHPGNLNATPAIVSSVVVYVLRLLVREPIPLNEGLLGPVEIHLPEGLLSPGFPDDPACCPAVVGGNTETSQRLVDTLVRALRLGACSQGTMNNVLFGNNRYGYYETLGGGCGAGPGFDGADAVHSHMTNTRITDPELIEQRYPVRVERFAVRRGSGGAGRTTGGDGIVRELTFLDQAELSVLTQHRRVAPYGMDGGSPGKTGSQQVLRHTGETVELKSIDGCSVEAGDRVVVKTPGGGGYGGPGDRA